MRICGPAKGVTKNSWELVECIGTQKHRSKTCNNDTREVIDKVRRVCGKFASSPASSDVFKNNQNVWVESQRSLGLTVSDGTGGSEVMIETSADSKMQGETQEFYAWLDEDSNGINETGGRERNNDSDGVTQVEVIVEAGGHEIKANLLFRV